MVPHSSTTTKSAEPRNQGRCSTGLDQYSEPGRFIPRGWQLQGHKTAQEQTLASSSAQPSRGRDKPLHEGCEDDALEFLCMRCSVKRLCDLWTSGHCGGRGGQAEPSLTRGRQKPPTRPCSSWLLGVLGQRPDVAGTLAWETLWRQCFCWGVATLGQNLDSARECGYESAPLQWGSHL